MVASTPMRRFIVVLAMSACASSSSPKPTPNGSEPPPPAPKSDLPATLAPADIDAGLAPAKATAKDKCANLAKGGELLKMGLLINGPLGTVTTVEVIEFADNAKLAHCYANELSAATFKKVEQEEIRIEDQMKF